MSIDIFIKSYENDFKFLYKALESIKKYVTGYNNIYLILPNGSNVSFNPPIIPDNLIVNFIEETFDGYMFQQYTKMTAFKYCQSDYIMFTDSDCIFNKHVNVSLLIDEHGRPEILMTKYEQVGDAICWKAPTENYFDNKFSITHEMMRRNALIYHRETLVNVSSLKPNLHDYIKNIEGRQFSEFNVISSFAYYYENDKYRFVDTDNWTYTPCIVDQYFSWGGYTTEIEEKINVVLK